MLRWKMRVEGDFVFGKLNSAGYTIFLFAAGALQRFRVVDRVGLFEVRRWGLSGAEPD
jgi:hypothetical protein